MSTCRTLVTSHVDNYKTLPSACEVFSDDEDEAFIDESDIISEIMLDDEDFPDADEDDELASEEMSIAEHDDSSHVFRGHTGPLHAVACSPTDSTLVASGSEDDKAILWRINQGDCLKELVGHKDTVSSLAFSVDGQLLASGGVDACVKIWDMSGNLKFTFKGPAACSEVEWVRWHPRAHLVLAGFTDTLVQLWNADKGAHLCEFIGHGGAVTCGDFTPDGKTICTGSVDSTLRKWNPRSGEGTLIKGYSYDSSELTCLAFTWDSTLALTGDDNGCVNVSNLARETVVCSLPSHTSRIHCIGLSSSTPWVATGAADHKLVIWDLQHSASHSICEHEDEVTSLKWLGDSKYVASGCNDGQINIWDTRSGQPAMTFKGHSDRVQDLSVSANHDFLVSASDDGTARVFPLSNLM